MMYNQRNQSVYHFFQHLCIALSLATVTSSIADDAMVVSEIKMPPISRTRKGGYKKRVVPLAATTETTDNTSIAHNTESNDSKNTESSEVSPFAPYAHIKRLKKKKDPQKERILHKKIPSMSLAELQEAKEYVLRFDNTELATQFVQQMLLIHKSDNQEEIRMLRLELADLYFDDGKMKQAGKEYRTYVKFYPGSKEQDTAQYKEILSRFYSRLTPPRDQSITHKTLALANVYLDKPVDQKAYEQDVQKIVKACHQDLYDYEIDIFKQYCTRKQFTGAQTRLAAIKKEFLPIMKQIEPELIEWEGALAQQQGKAEIVAQSIETLKTKFPEYAPTVLVVYQKPKKKDYVTRF